MQPARDDYVVVDFDQLDPVDCPCGSARRAFLDVHHFPATVHRTEIFGEAKAHYHQRLTETYYFLECAPGTQMQLNDRLVPVKPGMCILIPPGVRHRAVGHATVLVIVMPKFDPTDEVLTTD
jgi:mannose-6-phosphate isomerase-like protein (cupin superfamily)